MTIFYYPIRKTGRRASCQVIVPGLPLIHTYPLFTHCCTVRRNSKYPPSLLTSGLNRTTVYATALIKQCLIQKITATPIG